MARARKAGGSRMGGWVGRVLLVAAAGVLVWIALGHGEYSTVELLRQVAVRDSVLARLDNLTDQAYAGAVIVNEASRRYFEPAPGRQAWLGVSVSRAY